MIKPASLRAAITAAVPDLQTNPDKLLVFADAGNIVQTGTKSISFEYRYTLNLIFTDFAGDPDVIMVAMLAWVQVHQPELVNNDELRATGIAFEVDHLNQTTCDLSITLKLTEAVIVKKLGDGTHDIRHGSEPIPEWSVSRLFQ
jgi:hypothetical protein